MAWSDPGNEPLDLLPSLHPCCRCGGAGEEGHAGEPYDSADALDVCYHCAWTPGQCGCPAEPPD